MQNVILEPLKFKLQMKGTPKPISLCYQTLFINTFDYFVLLNIYLGHLLHIFFAEKYDLNPSHIIDYY